MLQALYCFGCMPLVKEVLLKLLYISTILTKYYYSNKTESICSEVRKKQLSIGSSSEEDVLQLLTYTILRTHSFL